MSDSGRKIIAADLPASVINSSSGQSNPTLGDVYLGSPSGGADDAANIRAAALLLASGGRIKCGPGLWKLGSTNVDGFAVPLTSNITVEGSGQGATIFQIQSQAQANAFRINETGTTDTLFQNITLQDFTLDANNYAITAQHTLIGSDGDGLRPSYKNIALRRVNTINVPTSDTTNTINFQLKSNHAAAGDTLSTITDITIEDVDFSGGATGAAIVAFNNNSDGLASNCFIDRVRFLGKYRHDSLTRGPANASSHVQVGANAYCGSVYTEVMYGANSGDVGFEFDNVADLRAGDFFVQDWGTEGVYLRNINYAVGGTAMPSQSAEIRSVNGTNQNWSAQTSVFGMNGNGTTTAYGDVHISLVHFRNLNLTDSRAPAPVNLNQAAFNRVAVDRVVMEMRNLNDATHTPYNYAVYIQPDQSCEVQIGHIELDASGTFDGGWFGVFAQDDNIVATLNLQIDSILWNTNITGGTGGDISYVQIVPNNAGKLTLSGSIRNLRVLKGGTPSNGGIRIAGTSLLAVNAPFVIDACDFTGAAGGNEINFSADGTSNGTNARATNIRWRSGQPTPSAAVTPGVGASPWTFTNPNPATKPTDGTLYLYGGTVSSVTTRSGTQVAASSPCAVRVASGDSAVITYTVAPTARWVPDC